MVCSPAATVCVRYGCADDAHQARAYTRRDALVEDEILHCGYFADVVFRFRTPSGEVEDVFGQRAIFSLLSPALRRQLGSPRGTDGPAQVDGPAAGGGRREVWLGGLTARGFREVARYVYKLPLRLSPAALPDVVRAAELLELDELKEVALSWGFACLAERAAAAGAPAQGQGAGGAPPEEVAEAALRCLEQLCASSPESERAAAWRDSLLRAHPAAEVLSCPGFFELSPAALQWLLAAEGALHDDPAALWTACVHWAWGRAPCRSAKPPGEPAEVVAPPRLFGRGARLAGALAPAAPAAEAVQWQHQLLPVVGQIRFSRMPPADFAQQLEALDPMLPELRQAIYAARRRDAETAPPPEEDRRGGPGTSAQEQHRVRFDAS